MDAHRAADYILSNGHRSRTPLSPKSSTCVEAVRAAVAVAALQYLSAAFQVHRLRQLHPVPAGPCPIVFISTKWHVAELHECLPFHIQLVILPVVVQGLEL